MDQKFPQKCCQEILVYKGDEVGQELGGWIEFEGDLRKMIYRIWKALTQKRDKWQRIV